MNKWIGLLVITSLAASPATGNVRDAAFASSSDRPSAQRPLFAGSTYRMALGREANERGGRAALTLTGMSRIPTAELKFGRGVEIRGGRMGKPALYLAGQNGGQLKDKTNLSGGTAAAIAIGAVVVAGVMVAAVLLSDATLIAASAKKVIATDRRSGWKADGRRRKLALLGSRVGDRLLERVVADGAVEHSVADHE